MKFHLRLLCLALSCGLAGIPTLRAEVDDAHTKAMELADGPYKKGFKVREDYWKGAMKSGEKKAVKAQLFKGNEYWFWLGCEEDDAEMSIDLFNEAGQKINVETIVAIGATGVRVVPPKTGTYVAVFTINLKKGKGKFNWALAFGYR